MHNQLLRQLSYAINYQDMQEQQTCCALDDILHSRCIIQFAQFVCVHYTIPVRSYLNDKLLIADRVRITIKIKNML